MSDRDSRIARYGGLALAGMGLAHYAQPEVFEPITRIAFPDDVRQHLFINGGIETALGVALVNRPTRKIAVVGLLGYLGYLGVNAARNSG